MAILNKRITELTAIPKPVPEDVIQIVDDVATTATNKKVGLGTFLRTYNRSAAEISNNTSNDDIDFKENHGVVLRYGTNTTEGTTDMTLAIQTAIDIAKQVVVSSLFTVIVEQRPFIPEGRYKTGQLKLFPGVILTGKSSSTTILEHSGTGLTDFIVVDETQVALKTSVQNMYLKGNGVTNTRYGFKLHQGFFRSIIDDVVITDCQHGMFLTDCFTLSIDHCHIRRNTFGVTWDDANAARIENTRIESNTNYNLKITNAGSVYISAIFQAADTDDSVILTECNGTVLDDCNFENNNRDNLGKADLNIQGSVVTINGGIYAQTNIGRAGILRNNGVAITANVGILSLDGVMITPGAFYRTGLKLTFSGAHGDTVIDACQLNDPDTVVESGTHDGANNAAILTDSGEAFTTNEFVGRIINNTTDGSSATITANDATTITGVLSGGTDDDWDTSDAYTITGGTQLDTSAYAGSVNYSGLGGTQVAHRQHFLGPVDRNHGIVIGDKTFSTAIQHTDNRGSYDDGVMVIIDPVVKTNLTDTEHTVLIDARTLISANISGITKGTTTTFITEAAHEFTTGWTIDIAGIVDDGPGGDIESTFNDTSHVITVVTLNTFTVAVNSSGLSNEWASAGTTIRAAAQTVTLQGTFDKPFFLGAHALWVNAANQMSIKNGTPSSDVDGNIFDSDLSEIVTVTNLVTTSESGKTFYLSSATEFVSTLPLPRLGLNFTFIVTAAPSGADYTVVTASSNNIMDVFLLDIVGEAVFASGQDVVTFVGGTSIVGDRLEVESDGTRWYCTALSGADGGITTGVT